MKQNILFKISMVVFFTIYMQISMVNAQSIDNNFTSRRAIIANICPSVTLSDFTFINTYDSDSSSFSFNENLSWENIGKVPIIALSFEIIKYDPFNDPETSDVFMCPGHNSANWTSLLPGENDKDGITTPGSDNAYTCIAFVKAVRFADGTIWKVDFASLVKAIKKECPDILDLSVVNASPTSKLTKKAK